MSVDEQNQNQKELYLQQQANMIRAQITELYRGRMDEGLLSELLQILTEKKILTEDDHKRLNQSIRNLVMERDKEIKKGIKLFMDNVRAFEAQQLQQQQQQQQQFQ